MADRKQVLLKRLEDFFKKDEELEEVSLFTAGELGTPMDVLRVLVTNYGPGLIDVLAEYSFLPLEGPDEVWYFSSVITIKTGIPKDGVSPLAGAIARLNFYLPYGGFCLSADGDMLIYKSMTALRTDHDDDKLYEDMELSADTALLIPESYTDLRLRISDGRLLINDFISTLPRS